MNARTLGHREHEPQLSIDLYVECPVVASRVPPFACEGALWKCVPHFLNASNAPTLPAMIFNHVKVIDYCEWFAIPHIAAEYPS